MSIGATKWPLRLPPKYRDLQPVFDTLLRNLDRAIVAAPGTAAAGGSGDPTLPRIDLASYVSSSVGPADATAGLRVGADGYLYARTSTAYTVRYAWVPAGRSASEYECRVTVTSGALTTGTAGSWLPCTSANTWEVTETSNLGGESIAQLTLEIREVATPANLTSAPITLDAYVEELYNLPSSGLVP